MDRCNLLFVASGVFFIVGTIVMVPGFFGDTNFFLYSCSSFGIAIVILTFACLCTSIIDKDDGASNSSDFGAGTGRGVRGAGQATSVVGVGGASSSGASRSRSPTQGVITSGAAVTISPSTSRSMDPESGVSGPRPMF